MYRILHGLYGWCWSWRESPLLHSHSHHFLANINTHSHSIFNPGKVNNNYLTHAITSLILSAKKKITVY